MPAILVEVGFIDFAEEAKRLVRIDVQQQASTAIAEAVRTYWRHWGEHVTPSSVKSPLQVSFRR